jgi:asparagine synthase (glutamine-hydrolysing)
MDPAVVANYLLAKRASEDVKVILGGDGGDEVFGGYRRYERALIPRFIPVRQMRGRGVFDRSGLTQFEGLPWRNDYVETIEKAKANTKTRLQSLQATDGADFLPHFHLMKFDRCLMAHGIEGRAPLLDQELARFGFNLPDRLKLRGQKGKWIVRKWLNDNMPEAKPFTPKRGFSVPVNQWIAARAPVLADFVCEQSGIQEVFDIDAVHKLFTTEYDTQQKYLWPVLFYACWHQLHIQRETAPDFSAMR